MSIEEQQLRRSPSMYVLTGILLSVLLILVVWGMFLQGRSEKLYAPALHVLSQSRLLIAESHVRLEELIAGDPHVSPDSVHKYLSDAHAALQVLADGGECPHGFTVVPLSKEVSQSVSFMVENAREFSQFAESRLAASSGAGAGSPIDEQLDRSYQEFRTGAYRVEAALSALHGEQKALFHRTQLLLLLASGLLGVLAIGVTISSEMRQKSFSLEMGRANQELNASNQQMNAANQQLRAQEQQLRASNQQLRATEQQLQAANQQLKASENQLRESEQRLRMLYESMVEGVALHEMVYDESGAPVNYRMLYVNPAFERMTGIGQKEASGKLATELYGVDEPPYLDTYAKVTSGEEPVTFETFFPPMEKHFHISAVSPQQGIFATVFLDVTENKRQQHEIEESERKYRALFEGSVDGIVITDAKTERFQYANQALCKLLGHDGPEDIVGKGLRDMHPASELPRVREEFRLHAAGKRTLSTELPCQRKDGSVVLADIATTVFEANGKKYMASFLRDVTERKRMNEEISRAQRLDSLGMLAGGIAHDFNNLLGGVFGYMDLARQYGNLNAHAAEYLDKALAAYNRARDLTRQLLTFSKGGEPIKRAAALDLVVRESASLALSGSQVSARFDIPGDLWAVEFDEGQVSQAVSNLVLNARQAMPTGGTVEITVSNAVIEQSGDGLPLDPGEFVRIDVADSGVGIPAEHLHHIFDPFFTTKQQGSGLGLATSYSIVKKHGGHIAVNSGVGTGTTFTVYLPADSRLRTQKSGPIDAVVYGHGRVLVMDDEEVVRDLAVDMLEQLGYLPTACKSGEQAVKQYRESVQMGDPFDAVILDLTVPGAMGGEEAIRRIREIDPGVKAIVSSGYFDNPVVAQYQKYGFAASVSKPYRLAQLSKTLRQLVEEKRSSM